MKVAFASKDGIRVDEHFGWCKRFFVYTVAQDGFSLTEVRDVPDMNGEVDRVDVRIKVLNDCAIVFCREMGAVAAARVVKSKIHPAKAKESERIVEILARLVEVAKSPPLWLKKRL